MEIFSIKLSRVDRIGNSIGCEWVPENIDLQDKVLHGATLEIEGTIAETTAAYEPTAAREMFMQLERMFPGQYQLDQKYG